MNQVKLFDVVELAVDLPDSGLRAGMRGAIVHCHSDDTYEVEFTDTEGETLALTPLSPPQFIIVWRADTQTWVPAVEQIAELLAHLPKEAERQVLDYARSIHARQRETA